MNIKDISPPISKIGINVSKLFGRTGNPSITGHNGNIRSECHNLNDIRIPIAKKSKATMRTRLILFFSIYAIAACSILLIYSLQYTIFVYVVNLNLGNVQMRLQLLITRTNCLRKSNSQFPSKVVEQFIRKTRAKSSFVQ